MFGVNNYFLQAHSSKYRLFELGPLTKFQLGKKGFCLFPYQNPVKKGIDLCFFPLLSQIEFEEKEFAQNDYRIELKASEDKQAYIKNVNEIKQHIQLGDLYEMNYCTEFFCENAEIDPLEVYLKLNQFTNAPYSSLVKIGDDFIICASPELFLKRTGKELITKPIKGTAPRGKNMEEDERLKEELYTSIKERTENVMAVDVARNDLSVIASRGSVSVNKLYNIESYQTVHQMVSTVKCELKENISFQDIIQATFPMASMTGAPKISAMNLIDEYEGFERKYYSGAMGRVEENGDFEFCVIIRSIFYNQRTKRLSIAVGSAITHLSDPEKEYEECLLKANALLRALNADVVS
ncbi:MAG TPA: anthranilate synthase component I family protein [Bacteroidia bacterium]|nr:anthranilate synthase component I family protein [Bacteroidia bacterium]